ncbi:MAG TPA: polyprenyl synthetase family protein [Firmicutes bacterium]|nr:polyprenyl synthetase family protein [Bacillota bacterium]
MQIGPIPEVRARGGAGSSTVAVEELTGMVERELREVLDSRDAVADLAGHLAQSGGKRIRPLLTLLTARLFGPEPPSVLPVAVATELVHMATLVHDDVLDEAPVRRGHPTIHTLWGSRMAVLAGDALLARALVLIAEHAPPSVLGMMARMVYDMCEGEVDQHRHKGDWRQSEETYFLRIEKKTARFFSACCEAGATLAGAPEAQIRLCAEYGLNLGMAFQMIDDLLDITGDPEKMGKPVGGDLREGVVTLPVLHLLAQEKERSRLLPLLEAEPTAETVEAIVQAVRNSSSPAYTRSRAVAYIRAARERLARLPQNEAAQLLGQLLDQVVSREK